MNYNTLKRILLAKQKGTFTSIVWERELPTRKVFSNQIVTKRCTAVVRCGVTYDNIKAVQQKRLNGILPPQNDGLKWGEWLLAPYFIKHKDKIYLRCAESKNNEMKVEYFLNGKRVDRSVIEPFCLKSAFTDHSVLDVFTVNIDNIIAIR